MICIQALRWRVLLTGAVAVVIAACSSGDDQAGPTASLGTAPPTTAADPYAIPEVIDVAYVNRVLEGLDSAVGEVTRMVVKARTIPPEAVERLKALYTGEFLQLSVDRYQDDMRDGFSTYKPDPGDPTTEVAELINASPTCVFARVSRDYSAVTSRSNPALSTLWVSLSPRDPNSDPNGYNPTPWAFAYDGFQEGRTQPSDPCAAS